MTEIKSNKSEEKSTNNSYLKRIGSFIKEARLGENQSIEELASNLKMGSHQLIAIEEGNEDLLPEKVFVKAMVRRISEKLKIDTSLIMKEFTTESEEVKVGEIVQRDLSKAKQNKSINKKYSIGFILFILISGVLGLLASSMIFDIFSNSSQIQMPKKELLQKN